MTPDLSIPNRCFDIPLVRIAPLPQEDVDAGLLGCWQTNRHLPLDDRRALLSRYASLQTVQSGSLGVASEADEPRHLRQVVGSEGSSRFLPDDCGGPGHEPASAAVF
ncbi:hypothetical protein [Rhodopseudomonas sp. BR0G17]|uniref:hypothetical protein n=1 Tax=Rhodopseudomonas sp. BR0G17 TaxID=2269368 RepID=UPI0013DE9F34|nr:hypothetical protein [Rhodopseudomonas sp. BR0G17]NEW96946.1 hypothetical protein [Rhodopseudomonas sp. BR0G17]